MSKKKEIYLHFSNCIPVRGYNRTAIYDLQKNKYILVPNQIFDLIQKNNYRISYRSITEEKKTYINNLVTEGYGTIIDSASAPFFHKIELKWDTNSHISNAQIDINIMKKGHKKIVLKTISQLKKLGCKNIQINFIEDASFEKYVEIIKCFNSLKDIESISLIIKHNEAVIKKIDSFFIINNFISNIIIYSSNKNYFDCEKNIYFTKNSINDRLNYQIDYKYFRSNIQLFSESLEYNNYFNKKIGVDSNGFIKNSPELSEIFGNILSDSISELLQKEKMQKYWAVKKDDIDVCKYCEYRYMCIDSCPPKKRVDGTWYRPIECNYNPFICKWKGEKKYLSLEKSGIYVSSRKSIIIKKKLDDEFKKIWT